MAHDLAETGTDSALPTHTSLLSRLRDWQDQEGWREFFDTYWRLIYNVARRTGLSDAEAQDVVQNTFICLARRMPKFHYDRTRGSFKSWLRVVTRSRIQVYHRGQKAQKQPRQDPDSVEHVGCGIGEARIRYWLASINQNWADASNWRVDAREGPPDFLGPQNGDDLIFDGSIANNTDPMFNSLSNLTVRSLTFRGSSDVWALHNSTFAPNTLIVTRDISTSDDSETEYIEIDTPLRLGGDVRIAANYLWDTWVQNGNHFEIGLNGPIDLNGHTLTVYAGVQSLMHVSGAISGIGDVVAQGAGVPDPDQLGKVVFDGTSANPFQGTLIATAGWSNDGQWYTSTVHFNKPAGVTVADHLRIFSETIVTLDAPEQLGDAGIAEIDGHTGRRARAATDGGSGVTVGGPPRSPPAWN